MPSRRVVVVGTTSDYIDLIRRRHPGRALFITDPLERAKAREEHPGAEEEIRGNLTDTPAMIRALADHMNRHEIRAEGVACFDCESLMLAAAVARQLELPFPSPSAVALSRNKFLSKVAWHDAKVACPRTVIARSRSDALGFLDRIGKPVILKPLTGSGSELVFKCSGRKDCMSAYETIIRLLSKSKGNRMYMPGQTACKDFDPLRDIVVEECIGGPEYSCDFFIENGEVEVIRTAKKIPGAGWQFGTTAAYVLPARLPGELSLEGFKEQIHRAARALGMQRALCMIDFFVCRGQPCLLELTPRVGGDCLPWLIRQSSGLDMLGLALDFSRGVEISLPAADTWQSLVGLRLFASHAGVVKKLDSRWLHQDPRVRELLIKRLPGHRVVLPPIDYDSRLLGHVIFKASGKVPIEEECAELASRLVVEMETPA